jgi:hypothetical protein
MSAIQMRHYLQNRGWLIEHSNCDDIEAADEMVAYGLIHELLGDIKRLAAMAMETRDEVNALSGDGDVYGMTAENVLDGMYCDHPALDRYVEMFGSEAPKPWEFL